MTATFSVEVTPANVLSPAALTEARTVEDELVHVCRSPVCETRPCTRKASACSRGRNDAEGC